MRYLFILAVFASGYIGAQTPAELKGWLPALEGWTVSEETEVFDTENLFDRINGAAPLFIENNFKEMTSLEYQRGKEYITIQAYRHATAEDAFGMYASERSSELTHYPIGGEAQGDSSSLFFFAGNIYVKMWSNTEGSGATYLHTIGQSLSSHIAPEAAYPPTLLAFPADGKAPYSEAYITANYLGHTFLKGAYTANYRLDEQTVQLFVIDGKSEEGVRAILDAYLAFTHQSIDGYQGDFLIQDRYNGDIPVLLQGHYILGIYADGANTSAQGAASTLLHVTANRLP